MAGTIYSVALHTSIRIPDHLGVVVTKYCGLRDACTDVYVKGIQLGLWGGVCSPRENLSFRLYQWYPRPFKDDLNTRVEPTLLQ